MTERGLTELLRRIADQAPAVRLPEDLWRRGRRLRRRRLVAGAAAVAVLGVVLAVPLFGAGGGGGPGSLTPADSGPAVPAAVYPPLLGQSTVRESPPGAAAILVTGEGPLTGTDLAWYEYEGRSLVVGRDGEYRLVRTQFGGEAGQGMLLSPGGRYVTGDNTMEGAGWPDIALSVLDLTNGKIRRYDGGLAVAWAPDGRQLLVQEWQTHRLNLLNLDSGELRPLMDLGEVTLRPAWAAAFSPDGGRVVVQVGDALHLIELADGSRREVVDLGSRRRLAGVGAWLPDGRRIAILEMTGCETDCDNRALNSRAYRIRYLDAERGVEVSGPRFDDVVGIGARLLGWQRNGDAVMVRHDANKVVHNGPMRATWDGTDSSVVGNVELIALHPGGGRARLVELPAGAMQVDVPRDLVEAGAFGGPSPSWVEGGVRQMAGAVTPIVLGLGPALVVLLFVLLLLVVMTTSLVKGWRRRRLWSQWDPPPSTE